MSEHAFGYTIECPTILLVNFVKLGRPRPTRLLAGRRHTPLQVLLVISYLIIPCIDTFFLFAFVIAVSSSTVCMLQTSYSYSSSSSTFLLLRHFFLFLLFLFGIWTSLFPLELLYRLLFFSFSRHVHFFFLSNSKRTQ